MTLRHWAVAGLVLAMAGCGHMEIMSNDEVIREVKKCEAAGMKAEFARYNDDRAIARVDCVTEEQYAFDHKGK